MGSFEEGTLKKHETNSVESDLLVLKGYMNVKTCLLFLKKSEALCSKVLYLS